MTDISLEPTLPSFREKFGIVVLFFSHYFMIILDLSSGIYGESKKYSL